MVILRYFRRFSHQLGPLAVVILVGAACLLTGCQEQPAAPVYENVFDPQNPVSENPFNVRASVGDTLITVIWDFPAGFDIVSYEVLHSLDPDEGFSSIGSLEPEVTIPPTTIGFLVFPNPEPTTTHYFRVLAYFADDYRTLVSATVPVAAVTPPRVIIETGSAFSASRYINLEITVSTEEFLRISGSEDFSDELEVAVPDPGSPQTVVWDLGPAAENLEEKDIFVLAFTGSALSDTAIIKGLKARFQPDFNPVGDPATVATRTIDLEIEDTGVLEMRFAASEVELAAAAWVPGDALYSGYELLDSLNPQIIYAEFAGDFGFNHTGQYTATPDPLTEVTFALDLPADNITDEVNVTCLCTAAATEMRFAETPSFVGVPWQEFAESAPFTLTPEEGAKIVYAQFRNDWAESAILTAEVIYVTQPVDVTFSAPAEGDEVTAGTALQVRGTSTAGSGTGVVDEVQVDTGDGSGFQPAAGTEEWTFWWDIPTVEVPTPVTLRARAFVGEESVTAVVNVTVMPAPAR